MSILYPPGKRSANGKEEFLDYLDKAAERFSIITHTYCLMSNHYNLLVEIPEANLSLALFIASDKAGYITGESIVASGGYR